MNWDDERAAFETRVKDNFTTVPVQYPGVSLKHPATTPWVRMQLIPRHAHRITLGPNATHRETGTLLFQIFSPANSGTAASRQVADELSALFHEAIFSYGDSGRIRCMTPELQTRGPTPDDIWYQINLLVDYERDVVVT